MRAVLRERRRALSSEQQQQAALALASNLQSLSYIQQATRIGLYWPCDGEIDPRFLMQHAALAHVQFFLPVIQDDEAQPLSFMRWQQGDVLKNNRYGIAEPVQGERITVADLDVLLLPLTGFDAAGNRLGMGGGYYDRALAYKRQFPKKPPYLIGVAHACQQVESLPVEAWDVPLDGVVVG